MDVLLLIPTQRALQQSLATSATSSASLLTEVEQQKLALSSERKDLEDLESANQTVVG